MKLFSQYKGLRRELYVLFIGRIMTNMGAMIWPMLTLILTQKLGMNAGQVANYFLLFSLVAIPMSIIGGKLADKFNKRNIIVICDIVSILGYLYCSMVPLTRITIIAFALSSLFQNMEGPSYDALVADFTTSEDRDRAYSLSYLGNNLGLVLSPTIGGLLFNEHLNLAFFINGCSIAVSTVLIFFLIRDVHRETDDSVQSAYEAVLTDGTTAFGFLKKSRVILTYLVMSAVYSTVYSMWNYLMPMDMANAHGEAGSVLFGTITSVNCIEVVVCTALLTRLVETLRGPAKMMIGQSLILLGYVIFLFRYTSIPFCYIAIIIFTFGEIVTTISQAPFLTRRIPASHRGRIMSIGNVFSSITGALIQKGIGTLYDRAGNRTAWLVVLGLGLVSLTLLYVIRKMDRKDYGKLYL